jgi:2-methylcitrate dehydratase PrpD
VSAADQQGAKTSEGMDERVSSETRELLEFLHGFSTGDVPEDVLHESKRCLIDFLGVAIGASAEPAPTIVLAQMKRLGGEPQAAVFGTNERLRVSDAALVNGVAGHVFDFDDTHIPTILHPSTPLYAAALALSEWRGRPGRELLAAHALGYEVGARVSLALYPHHYDVGWHMTGTAGTLAAAAASSRLLGLSQDRLAHCMGLASTQAAGHREQFGAMTKSFHAGNAAHSGMLSALLAEAGYTAAPDSLQGRRGMLSVMSSRSTPADLVEALGSRWEIFRNGIKPYACGVVSHPPIDAVRRLGVEQGLTSGDVERIELRVHPLVAELTGKDDPRTGLEGKFSVQFACSIALLEGAARERQFSDENVRRADVRDLMARIRLVPTDEMPHEAAAATATTSDGRQLDLLVEAATGTPGNPIPDDELLEKFHDLVDPVLGRAQAASLVEEVWRLDGTETVDALIERAVSTGA